MKYHCEVLRKEAEDRFLVICNDCDENDNPRSWDNVGRMLCWHRRYNLGDQPNEFSTPQDFLDFIKERNNKNDVVLPLFLLDHSGLSMRCQSNFNDCDPGGWDSGQVGFIWVSAEKIRAEWKVRSIQKSRLRFVEDVLKNEVKIYDQFLRGEVYNYYCGRIEACNLGDKHYIEEDSCGGFFGSEWKKNGMSEYLPKEYQKLLEAI